MSLKKGPIFLTEANYSDVRIYWFIVLFFLGRGDVWRRLGKNFRKKRCCVGGNNSSRSCTHVTRFTAVSQSSSGR